LKTSLTVLLIAGFEKSQKQGMLGFSAVAKPHLMPEDGVESFRSE